MSPSLARAAFLRACLLDVAVRKPGNVSVASPGHRMHAALFTASAEAAAGPLFLPGASVGERIEAAVRATWAAAGCNTNLGIVLLAAPLAVAAERLQLPSDAPALRREVAGVLAHLDLDDARAAYRAIAHANPGGLGDVAAEDARQAPSVDLRTAMALAAGRDVVARQYRDGYADLFDEALLRLAAAGAPGAVAETPARMPPGPAQVAAVQRLYLGILARWPDSHIVRKHGEAVAQNVMSAAQAQEARAEAGIALDTDPDFTAWDEALKAAGINPGTSADLTVATLFIAGLLAAGTG